jgi:hypothetical protein
MNELVISSLDAARAAVDNASAAVSHLVEKDAVVADNPALARALTARAEAWRAVARFGFEDVVAGDLLERAALEAARLDDLFAQNCPAGNPSNSS